MEPIQVVVVGGAAIVALIGGMFGVAVAIKSLFFKPVDPDKEYVTRAEFDRKFNELKTDITTRLDKLHEYSRVTSHEAANSFNMVALKVERLLAIRELESTITPKEKSL